MDAQYNLGVLYEKKDRLEEAKNWYSKAASQGDKEAAENLKILEKMGD